MGSKITADGDHSHEIKRRLLLGRKVMTNLDSILKSRDITLPTKVRLVKAMVLPVVMYGCESWTEKKAEHRRIDAEHRRLLRVPWTARRSNQSILKEISPGISLEGMMLKLKLQSFGHFMWRVDSLEKTVMLGGIGGKKRRGRQRTRWLDGITVDGRDSQWTPGVGDGQGGLACCDSWGRKESDMTERLIWSDLIWRGSGKVIFAYKEWIRISGGYCVGKGAKTILKSRSYIKLELEITLFLILGQIFSLLLPQPAPFFLKYYFRFWESRLS